MSTTPIEQRPSPERLTLRLPRMARPTWAWLWWAPAAIGALYALIVLLHLPTILNSVWLSSDSDIDAVLAHASAHAPAGALMTTGDFPHYQTMAFTLLTRSWPAYREIWQIAPVVFLAIGLAAVIWSVARSFGRWQAGLVGGVLVCFGGGGMATVTAGGLATVLAIDAHANTLITAAVCGALLVWALPRAARLSAGRLALVAVVIGVLGGLPLAGDNLYLAWGVAPLLVVTVLSAWRGPTSSARRVLAFGLGALALTVVTALVFAAIMRGQGVRGFSDSYRTLFTFVTEKGVVTNFQTFLRALPSITAGSFFGKAVTQRSEYELVSALLLFTALGCVLWAVRRRIANALPRAAGGGEMVGERFVHTAFWATMLIAGLAIFMIGSPNPWTSDGRYLLGPYVAIAALLPLLIERGLGWKLIVAGGATAFALSAVLQFSDGVLREMPKGYQSTATARQVAAFARSEHVSVAYGDYWNSIDLSWNSDFKVDVHPIQRCFSNPRRLCTFDEISLSGWDSPHGHVRSMLVANPDARQVRVPERAFGRPLAVRHAGDLILYVYPYDIATRLGKESRLTV